MPITADRVMSIIDTAEECYKGVSRLREAMRKINGDIAPLLFRTDLPDDVLDLIARVRAETEAGFRFEIPSDFVQNLFYEKAKFEINEKKNKYAREKMRVLRAGVREGEGVQQSITRRREFVPRGKSSPMNPLARILAEEDDLKFFIEQGQKYHPNEGKCDGDPCEICRRLGTGVFASRNNNVPGTVPDGFEESDPFVKGEDGIGEG